MCRITNTLLQTLLGHGNTPFIVSRAQGITLTHAEFARQTVALALGLGSIGFKPGTRICASLDNSVENALLQTAAAVASLGVATVKASSGIPTASTALDCHGSLTESERDGFMIQVERDRLNMHELIAQFAGDAENYAADYPVHAEKKAEFFYNTQDPSKSVSVSTLLTNGANAHSAMSLSPADSMCLPLTLNHPMGFGFGLMSAGLSGARVVLPSRDHGNAGATKKAMSEEKCSVLLADSRTLSKLQQLGAEPPRWLRCGMVKVGSGDAIGEGEKWGDVSTLTVGSSK
ncbi:hypothetical protein TeGR_g7772 [Tetraparma gracilis]|uniref:AMP-dependent synthetase/ligase domain-containing protein n=1 Tax=Tetraparma gracilis TaxID=2962635 RepID=A0ABQ6N5H6_9STRA|nr:hypothetical protein TeGR_g7772 [Tetraparma gracilis]